MPVYVSAVYKIYDNAYTELLWKRVGALPTQIYVFCEDVEQARPYPNVIPICVPFRDLATYSAMCNTTRLPQYRNAEKDTKEYMILICAKTEFIERAKSIVDSQHYVWIDAGISKVVSSPDIITNAIQRLEQPLLDTILIPGCWSKSVRDYNRITWRFCGGLIVIPKQHVTSFYTHVLNAVKECAADHELAIWEVTIWALIEHLLPIQWELGDHNDAIFNCINHYKN